MPGALNTGSILPLEPSGPVQNLDLVVACLRHFRVPPAIINTGILALARSWRHGGPREHPLAYRDMEEHAAVGRCRVKLPGLWCSSRLGFVVCFMTSSCSRTLSTHRCRASAHQHSTMRAWKDCQQRIGGPCRYHTLGHHSYCSCKAPQVHSSTVCCYSVVQYGSAWLSTSAVMSITLIWCSAT